MSSDEEFRRTIVHGEAALKQIKACKVPAFPRHYELWYTYSAGFDQKLNKAVNEIIRNRGRLSLEETTYLYDTFLSPFRLGDRLDQFGSDFNEELESILDHIGDNLNINGEFSDTLEVLSNKLKGAKTDAAVKSVVHDLVAATAEVRSSQKGLEEQLRESQAHVAELKENLETARFETLTDDLTGLGNRKLFDQTIERTLQASKGISAPFCLLMLDIDHFKSFNDTYGHQTGDQVLRLVAITIKNNIKVNDIASRYGGEEFAVVLPDTTLDEAMMYADQIREAVKQRQLVKRSTGESLGNVTISIGAAQYRDGDTVPVLIERADTALYAAKRSGRNKVVSEEPVSPENRMVS